MANYDFDIGVIGGGAAGLTVTAGATQLGAKTLLVEREPHLGGDCLHYGCVPSKTLIRTAQVYHLLRNAGDFGLPAVDPGPVDFRQVSRRIHEVVGTIQEHDSPERFCRLGAKVEFGEAEFVDEHAIRLNGSIHSARTWVIATGSSPALPPIPGLESTPHITNREIFSLERLPCSLLILGGGPIGIEMSQAFVRLGSRVIVVERAPQILGKEDQDMAAMLQQVLEKEGVEFHLGASVRRVRPQGGEAEVEIETASGDPLVLRGDTLLVAAGRVPNVHGLGLENLGVEIERGGIKVDRRLRTGQRHIYAAGDVNGGYQFTHAAGYEAGVVLANAVFRLPRKTDYTFMPWCTYTDPELASIGMNEKRAAAANIDYQVWEEPFRRNDRSLAEKEEVGKIKLLVDERQKPIGVQILGPQAGELVSEWVAVMAGKVKLATLAAAVHPYPTLGEINKRVAGNLMASKLFSARVKKGLRFFFSLKGRACDTEAETA